MLPAHPRRLWCRDVAALCLVLLYQPAWGAEAKSPNPSEGPAHSLPAKFRLIGKSHTIVAVNDLSGPGSSVPNLATTFDMTLLESSWGGRQSRFNGAGITTNATYPLTEGAAITTNDHLGAAVDLAKDVEAGFLWQFYAAGGNRAVGRTFGEELPWDNFDRQDGRVVQEHVSTDLHRAWLKDTKGDLTYSVIGGNLEDLDLTRREINFMKLGSLLYRPPVVTASFFGKGDRRLEAGRHPLRGAEAVMDVAYLEGRHVHGEVFLGRTKPTPVQEMDRDVVGTRWGVDVLQGNLGVSYVASEGERNPTITGERQSLWALDASYPLIERLALYGTWARSAYHRSGRLNGNAWIGGMRLLGPWRSEWRAQYQYLGENYELMGHHKTEHYPTNFHGLHASLSAPVGQGSATALFYRLRQIETNTRAGDAIFGDSYFPALGDSKRGDFTAYRVAADYDAGKLHQGFPKLSAYLEQAFFRKDAPDSVDNDIDKTVTNWVGGVSQPLLSNLTLDLSYRLVRASGRWQAMRFHHRQGIPEVTLAYCRKEQAKDTFRVTATYHRYDFVDSIAAAAGNNNYEAHQVLVEVWWVF